jgi:hypothetical protein
VRCRTGGGGLKAWSIYTARPMHPQCHLRSRGYTKPRGLRSMRREVAPYSLRIMLLKWKGEKLFCLNWNYRSYATTPRHHNTNLYIFV